MSKSSEIHWCCFCQKTSENKDVGAKKNKVWAKKLMLKLIDTWDSKER